MFDWINKARLLVLLCASLVVDVANGHELDAHDQIRQACQDLVLDYAFYRDRLDADAIAALFSEDAEMTLRGTVYSGREAIRERIASARELGAPLTRHLMSTIRIFVDDATHAHGVSYVTVYSGDSPVEGFAVIGEYHDTFELAEGGWRISRRSLKPVFSYQDQ